MSPADHAWHARWLVGLAAGLLATVGCAAEEPPALRVGTACPEVVVREVNDAWLASHPSPGDNKWARAVYFIGNMAAYEAVAEPRYLDHALRWAEQHGWQLHDGPSTRNADDHTAGQVYLALHRIDPRAERLEAIRASIDAVIASGERGDWSWVDALFMAGPAFAALGEATGDPAYARAMVELYRDAKTRRLLFEPAAGLWYRDGHYVYPFAMTPAGEPVFWSRGNGWVIASLALMLDHLPADAPEAAELRDMLATMAAALAPLQRDDGLWNVSLGDPEDFPGPESSGTALVTFALAWGIRDGVLDAATYIPVVERAWRGLVEHTLHADGTVGYVQGVGERPSSSQPVELASTRDFGVGAVLLAGAAVHALDLDWGCPVSASP